MEYQQGYQGAQCHDVGTYFSADKKYGGKNQDAEGGQHG